MSIKKNKRVMYRCLAALSFIFLGGWLALCDSLTTEAEEIISKSALVNEPSPYVKATNTGTAYDVVHPALDLTGWTEESADQDKRSFITNPINGSKIGLFEIKRSIAQIYYRRRPFTWEIVDSNMKSGINVFSVSSLHEGQKLYDFVYVDGKSIYPSNQLESDGRRHSHRAGIQDYSYYSSIKFYKKGNTQLKGIAVDEINQVINVYDMSLERNMNFRIQLSIINTSDSPRSFALERTAEIRYYVSVYALGRNRGFYFGNGETYAEMYLKKGLSQMGFSKYKFYLGFNSLKPYFGVDMSRNGEEVRNSPRGTIYVKEDTRQPPYRSSPGYALFAEPKMISPNEAFVVTQETLFGAIPFIQVKSNIESFDVYNTHEKDLELDLAISQLLEKNGTGEIYLTYPDGKEYQVGTFTGNDKMEAKAKIKIERAKLPKVLEEGTYPLSIFVLENGRSSQDIPIDIKVSELNAKPVPKVTTVGQPLNVSSAKELLTEIKQIPGNKLTISYVDKTLSDVDFTQPGLSILALQIEDRTVTPVESTTVKVPISVVDPEAIQEGSFVFSAKDFIINTFDLSRIAPEKLNDWLLEKASVQAWHTDDVTPLKSSISDKTLDSTSPPGKYTMEVQVTSNEGKTYHKTVTVDLIELPSGIKAADNISFGIEKIQTKQMNLNAQTINQTIPSLRLADYKYNSGGWVLRAKRTPFMSTGQDELTGAKLMIQTIQPRGLEEQTADEVQVVNNEITTHSSPILLAEKGKGRGNWLIEFGGQVAADRTTDGFQLFIHQSTPLKPTSYVSEIVWTYENTIQP